MDAARRQAASPSEFQYSHRNHVDLEGRFRGEVNLSKLPPLQESPWVELNTHYPIGDHIGTVLLPPPPGIMHTESQQKMHRHLLGIHIFDLGEPSGRHAAADQPRYALATNAAIGQLAAIASGEKHEEPVEGEGIITLAEGDEHAVGRRKGNWSPGLGTSVELTERDPALARVYASVSRDHGVFRVRNGELTWEDNGYNGSTFVYSPDLSSEHSADQSFMATRRLPLPEQAIHVDVASVFDDAPVAEPDAYAEVTGHPPHVPV